MTLLLNSNFLGAKGLGSIGLIVLSITITLLFTNLIHTSIVYYANKVNNTAIYLVSYLWSFVSVAVVYSINYFFPFFPAEFANHIYFLALLQSFVVINLNILLSKEDIAWYNMLNVLQSVTVLIILLIAFLYLEFIRVESFILALYVSYSIVFLISLIKALKALEPLIINEIKTAFILSIQYGFHLQSANVFQLLNYRISYFILDFYSGRSALGIYTAGIQLSESLLLPGKSISVVQYARISAKNSDQYAIRISLLLMKLSFLLTSFGMICLLLIPESWLIGLLGESFEGVKAPLLAMSIGIIALSAEVILSHFFSGTGRQKVNSSSALIGLIITLTSAFWLIPLYGAVGAAISASAAFSSMLLYMMYRMYMNKQLKIKDLLIKKEEISLFRRLLSKK